jgi:hypothetical protein
MAALSFFCSGGMPDESSKKLHQLTLIEVDAGCGLQSRFFVWRAMPGQGAVAVCLAAKQKTDRLRISTGQ